MGKSKRKKNKPILLESPKKESEENSDLSLPEKCIHMNIKSGTKMRNVLEFALKEFPNNDGILWTAAGEGVGKAISCAEIFKRKHPGLHQVTKLGSIESQKSLEEKDKDVNAKVRYVAQINILLTKTPINNTNTSQNDTKLIWNSKTKKNEELSKTEKKRERSDSGKSMSLAAEECEEMEFKFRQKRSRKEQYTEAILKKNKREES